MPRAWLKCWHPDVFCAALLNSQPMGFYAPGADRARRRGAWGRGPAGLRQRLALGLHPGADGRRGALRGAARPAHGPGPRQRPCRRHRRGPGRPALRLGRRPLAPRVGAAGRARPARRGRCLPPRLRPRPARGALGDQGAGRRAPAALRRRRGPRGADRARGRGAGRRAPRRCPPAARSSPTTAISGCR